MSAAGGKAALGLASSDYGAPKQTYRGDRAALRKSFRGDVERGHKVAATVSNEPKPDPPGTATLTTVEVSAALGPRKSKQMGAKGGIAHLNPQRILLPSQSPQSSQSSLGSQLHPTVKPNTASQETVPIYPILPMQLNNVPGSDSRVINSGVHSSTSAGLCSRPRILPNHNTAEIKIKTPQHPASTGGPLHEVVKSSIVRPNTTALSTTALGNNASIVPLSDQAKSDKEADVGAIRTPTATIWKDPILPSTYPRDSKRKKERALVRLTRTESATSSPYLGGWEKECSSPSARHVGRRGVQHAPRAVATPKTPKRVPNAGNNGRRTYPPTTPRSTVAPCSDSAAGDEDGWELTIAAQILTHGPNWEHSVQEPLRVGSPGVIVTDSSIPKSIDPKKGEVDCPVLNDDELMQRCWDERWTWNQFEEAMGLQGWDYNLVPTDGDVKRPGDHNTPQDSYSCEDKAIHPQLDVSPDVWHKSRLSSGLTVAQTKDSQPTPHLATTENKSEAGQVISPSAPEICAPLSVEEVTKLHSSDFHNDNVYWIDGVSYAYSGHSQPSTNPRTAGSGTSTELDMGSLNNYASVDNHGDETAVPIPHTDGESQHPPQAHGARKVNPKTRKVILRIQANNLPAKPAAPTQASVMRQYFHAQDHNEGYAPNAEYIPRSSPTYTEMLYSESIPCMDWVLRDHLYTDLVSVTGVPIYEPVFQLDNIDDPNSDLDTTSVDQAWRLWVDTIGSVPSVQRAMGPPDILIPTDYEEQTHPTDIWTILPQGSESYVEVPLMDGMVPEQELEPSINLPSLDAMVREILGIATTVDESFTVGSPVATSEMVASKSSNDPLGQPFPPDLEEGEIASPVELEEGEIFEAQPPRLTPRPTTPFDRAFDDIFESQLNAYVTSARGRGWKKRCIRPDEAFGERNNPGRGKGSPALSSLAAQYANPDGEQQLKATSGARFHRHGINRG